MLFTKVSPLFLGTAAALLLLSGCAAEDPYAPVEAPEIDSKFDIDKVWADSIGSGVGDFWSALRPDFAAGTVYAASRDGDVFGIVAADGDKIWHTDLSDEEENDSSRSTRLSGGVSAYAGKVAVGSENGYLYLLNAIDGTLLWKNYTASELVSRPAFSKSGDRVFVMDHRGRVFAYDCATGEQLWVSGDSPNVLRLRAQSDIVPVGDDFLVMGQSNGKVAVLLQSTGAIVNSLTIAEITGANALARVSDVSATPVFDGSDLWVISYNGGMVRYSFAEHRNLVKLAYSSSLQPAMDEEVIVITNDDGHLFCINRSDYSERWSNTALSYRNVTAPVIYGDYAVAGDYEGYLYFFNLENGSIDGMFSVDGSGIYDAPVIADGKLYVTSRDGDLYCYDYDPTGSAFSKETAAKMRADYAAVGVDLRAPGVGDSGIYAPDSISMDALMARRAAVIQAARQAEARQRAAEAQMREYEKRRQEYEERVAAERERLSGFGIAP